MTTEYSFRRSKQVTKLGATFHKDLFDIIISADEKNVNIKMYVITGYLEIEPFKQTLITQLAGKITLQNSANLINFLERIFGTKGYIPINSIVKYSFAKDKTTSSVYAYNSSTGNSETTSIPFDLKKVLFDVYSTFPSNKSGTNRLELNKNTGKSIKNIRSNFE